MRRRGFGRRRVLRALASLAPATGLAGRVGGRIPTVSGRARPASTAASVDDTAASAPTVDPVTRLDLPGVTEAVVDDDGETVYCALGDGFGVLDASNPFDPTVLYTARGLEHPDDAGKRPMTSVRDVKVFGDRLLVAGPTRAPRFLSQALKGFFLYDVSDPANPECVAFHETAFGPHNSFIHGDHVYLTGSGEYGEPVAIYDVSDDDPMAVARWSAADADDAWRQVQSTYRNAHDVFVHDDVLYVAYWDAGTWLVDVSDNTEPTALGRLGGHDPRYLASLDPLSSEYRELPGNSHSVVPNADATAVFVGQEAIEDPLTRHDGGPGGVELWETNGADSTLACILQPPRPHPNVSRGRWTAHNFGVRRDRLYTSWHGGGVRVYDVADLTAPRLLGEWREPSSTWFWTARPLASGFVATSYLDPSSSLGDKHRGEGAAVYVFPDPPGDDAIPAPLMNPRPVPDDPGDDGDDD